MSRLLFSLVVVLLLSPLSSLHAQTPCGNIIEPIDYDYQSPLTTTPITDCANPFGVSSSIFPYTFNIDGVTVGEGGVLHVAVGGTRNYRVLEPWPEGWSSFRWLYKHVGNDYQYIDTNDIYPQEADYRRLALQYFPTGTDVEPYVQALVTRSYGDDETFQNEAFAFSDYVDANFLIAPPTLQKGVYTLVVRESLVILTVNFWQNMFATLIPTAYAQSLLPAEHLYTLTFEIKEGQEPTGASSVLFLPGIQASRLYMRNVGGTENKIWEPNTLLSQDVRKLAMDTNGTSQNQLYTRDIMSTIPFGGTVYDSFARFMVGLVADGVIKKWTPFAYDWRYSVTNITENGTNYEEGIRDAIDEIEYLASSSFSGKVTIIGHSNGGLLAKAIMRRLEAEGKAHLVDKVVLLASPQLGTPKAIGTILHGYDQEKLGGWIIDDTIARDVIKDMPGAYGLIPTQKYFDATHSPVVSFDTSTSTGRFRTAYGNSIDNETELKQFMTGSADGRPDAVTIDNALKANDTMLTNSLNDHRTLLDTWVAPAGIKVIEVVGVGIDTVQGFEYRGFTEKFCTLLIFCHTQEVYKPVPIISQYGDKTVVGQSAEGYQGVKDSYYLDIKQLADLDKPHLVEHYNITETPSIQNLIQNIIKDATSTNIQFISTTTPKNFSSNRIMFGVHSPVQIEVRDKQGHSVTRVASGIPSEDIPGSSYLEVGDSKYVIVPDGVQYDLVLKGTGSGGVTFSLDALQGEVQTKTLSVNVATITASTTIQIPYIGTTIGNLSIDINSDGLIDTILSPQGVDITPKITYGTLKSEIEKLPLSTLRKAPLLILVAVADTLDKKSVTNPKLAPLELLALNQLESLIKTYQKKGWVTQADATSIIIIINKLK